MASFIVVLRRSVVRGEDRLSMLGRSAAQRPAGPPAAAAAAAATGRGSRRGRRRALAACAVLAVALHVAFLDGV
ncbi:MAG: hypothetical protein ACXWUL_07480, partial [Caldimonas sp.]